MRPSNDGGIDNDDQSRIVSCSKRFFFFVVVVVVVVVVAALVFGFLTVVLFVLVLAVLHEKRVRSLDDTWEPHRHEAFGERDAQMQRYS